MIMSTRKKEKKETDNMSSLKGGIRGHKEPSEIWTIMIPSDIFVRINDARVEMGREWFNSFRLFSFASFFSMRNVKRCFLLPIYVNVTVYVSLIFFFFLTKTDLKTDTYYYVSSVKWNWMKV